ncbi:hydantoinase/oxoprolinase family protein [Chelatococcus asaccharovorans]|uniref:hydantoinase/oxoprolinase family protein n=1 Tax=Chelatococcus asaccharovorans TaxID=28210 RepID=UPI00224C6D5A|nr:hydantoinase/oxoprolinase family protein [Chelatococcus asaccharovorans]CAH1650413.1 N-methylhydantoinase A [Chelatococcus asaccharovorans]CAH1692268.1 N-methylhydantoinase A [Chelatococcus asaccharovorans]
MTHRPRYRLGVDIGGTFTDLAVVEEDSGRLLTFKTPSVPADPARAVLNGINILSQEHGIAPHEIDYFVHGTTLGLNTLLQRNGATTGLLVTRGFRDLLEIGRLRLPDPTNYYVERIKPLVARRHVREIDERLRVDGTILTPLDLDAATDAARGLMAEGVTSVAIVLMHAYRNPVHEKLLADHLRRELPELYVCASHEVWPQQREYERGLVTAINAFIGHRMRRYFDRLHDDMAAVGLKATVLTTKSNGGIMAAASAARSPVETLLSGPASGAMGALMTGLASGNRKLIGFDMGGTSVDVAIIDGDMLYSTESHIGDFPLIMPAVDISSIGAGGGSIAWLDSAGILKVGPQSAGAMPGPASYGHGGDKPTVTDAYVRMGLYSPGRVLGGGLTLDHQRAETALATLAGPLGLTTAEVAQSILDVTTANMFAQFMPLMARKGLDPRDFRLLAYGGAGPQHAFLLAREIGVEAVVVPASPGTLCAQGSLAADLRQDFIRTMPAGHPNAQALVAGYDELVVEASQWLANQPIAVLEKRIRLSADMRYHGQSFDLTVPLDSDAFDPSGLPALIEAFHAAYERIYGFSDPAGAIEITNVRVTVLGITPKVPQPALTRHAAPGSSPEAVQHLPIIENGITVQAAFYDRATLAAGHRIEGPAVIEAPDTTIYLPGDFTAEIDTFGNLIGRLRAPGDEA